MWEYKKGSGERAGHNVQEGPVPGVGDLVR